MSETVITAALTGPIATKRDNPTLPISPEEIAGAAKGAREKGAAVVHLHLRDGDGRPTADAEVARRVIDLIGEQCDALIQLSTGVGLEVPFEEREKLVEIRPQMATLNVGSMSFAGGEFRNPPDGVRRLAARMGELGVKPELEIYDTGHLDLALAMRAEGFLLEPLQFSIVLGVRGGAAATAENLVHMVGQLPPGCVWQAIGIGPANVPITMLGLSLGGNARTGMEDTLMMRRGGPAESNAQLVERLVGIAELLDRHPVGPERVAEILGLGSA